MLSRSAARAFFLTGTFLTFGVFIALTVDTFRRIPAQTNSAGVTPEVAHGKKLWEENNCMGCHTLLGEGAYYAPELTRVHSRRGEAFIDAMLRDPEAMFPGQRRMVTYDFTQEERDALVAFFAWIDGMDLNGFPAEPPLRAVAVPQAASATGLAQSARPQIYNQLCAACHALGGEGGVVGPALDGIADRMSGDDLRRWLADPSAVKPETRMPKLPLTSGQIDELVAFLTHPPEEAGR